MRVFKLRTFARFARREGVADAALVDAVERAQSGLVDGDLGGGLIKQRVARPGGGRRSGYRAIVAIAPGDRAVFLYAFAKNDRANIRDDELAVLRANAKILLALDSKGLEVAIDDGLLIEVQNGYDRDR